MKSKVLRAATVLQVVFPVFAALGVYAQSTATLTGSVRDINGQPIADVTLSAQNASNQQSSTAHTDNTGKYTLSDLSAGDYDVTASAAQWATKSAHVSLAAGASQTLDFVLTQATAQSQNNDQQPPTQAPSLSDLGFSTQQTQGDPKLQAMLQRRTEMLRIHQKLGLITAIPMAAALITGPMVKVEDENGRTFKKPSQANLDFHAALGGTTTALYFSAAYFAIRAPHVPGTHKKGAILMHEALALVHGSGMIATPILGYMAYKQENSGERVHGIASAHGPVAVVTAMAYGASIIAVSWPIHVKFWERK